MLKVAKEERAIIDKKLGIVYEEDRKSSFALQNDFIMNNERMKVILNKESSPSESSGSGNISDRDLDEMDHKKVVFQTEFKISKENR